jgi:hypothetical protein
VTLQYGFGDPGTTWLDHTCAAWATGNSSGLTSTDGDYAGIGVILSGGDPYSVSGYTGVRVTIENAVNVFFFAKTYDGNYFSTPINAATGEQVKSIPFSSLLPSQSTPATAVFDRTQVIELQFTAVKPLASFGFAVHLVELY